MIFHLPWVQVPGSVSLDASSPSWRAVPAPWASRRGAVVRLKKEMRL